MADTSLKDTLAAVDTLNSADQPFKYQAKGNQIVGEWKYLDAKWAGPIGAGTTDKEFKVTISFNEEEHSFTSEDQKSASDSKVSAGSDDISIGKSKEGFKGKTIGKEFGFGIGKADQKQNETGVPGTYKYNFDTSEIKDPLFKFLEEKGWKHDKGGLLGKLFG